MINIIISFAFSSKDLVFSGPVFDWEHAPFYVAPASLIQCNKKKVKRALKILLLTRFDFVI